MLEEKRRCISSTHQIWKGLIWKTPITDAELSAVMSAHAQSSGRCYNLVMIDMSLVNGVWSLENEFLSALWTSIDLRGGLHQCQVHRFQTKGEEMSELWKCWYCSTQLIHGADVDVEYSEGPAIESNLSCPKCGCLVLVYKTLDKEENVFPHP